MRLGQHDRDDAGRLELGGDGIVAEKLSKAYHDIAERAFEAPTPVLTRALRGRRPAGIAEEETAEDDDADDDDAGIDDDQTEEERTGEEAGAVWALRDASFRIARGSAVAVVGGSRSGKTTLLRVLGGAVPPTSGRAVLAGRPSPLITLSLQLMAQTLTPEANVAAAAALVGLGRRRIRPQVEEILSLAEVSAQDRRAGVTRSTYKLAVATAVALGSDVLLLDDPFASATSAFRDRVLTAIEERRAAGATVLIETRDRDAMRRLCELAIWLDGGTVVKVGRLAEILPAFDAVAARTEHAGPLREATAGFNESAAIAGVHAEVDADRRLAVRVKLESVRAAVTVQTGIGLERSDGVGLWFEQPEPVHCDLPGFHDFVLVAHDVPPGVYKGRVQVRLFEGGNAATLGRRRAFELVVGTAPETAIPPSEVEWRRQDGSWLYEPEDLAG